MLNAEKIQDRNQTVFFKISPGSPRNHTGDTACEASQSDTRKSQPKPSWSDAQMRHCSGKRNSEEHVKETHARTERVPTCRIGQSEFQKHGRGGQPS